MMARIFYGHWNAVTRRYFAAQDFACVGFAQNKGLGFGHCGAVRTGSKKPIRRGFVRASQCGGDPPFKAERDSN